VLLDRRSGRLFAANRIGAEILNGVEAHCGSDAIAAGLCEKYGVPLDRAKADTSAFLNALAARGLAGDA
jgi:hypothetical protein